MSRTLGLAMRLRKLARPGLTTLTLAIAVGAVQLPASARVRPTETFVVDGVKVAASGAELQGTVLSSNPGDATQESTVLDLSHRRVISVIAVPFGTRPATEDALPFARRGGAQAYRQALHDYRSRGGEFALDSSPIHLFGRLVQGDVAQRTEHVKTASGREVNRDVFTVEWVTEAGPRLWIVRARQFEPPGHGMDDVYDFANSLSGLTIWAEGSLSAPTTIVPDTARWCDRASQRIGRSDPGPQAAVLRERLRRGELRPRHRTNRLAQPPRRHVPRRPRMRPPSRDRRAARAGGLYSRCARRHVPVRCDGVQPALDVPGLRHPADLQATATSC